MKIIFGTDRGARFKKGRIVFAKPDSLESKEWAPFQFATACKAGEELKTVPLDDNSACEGDVFSFLDSVEGPCVALIQDWAGATYMIVSKG